VALVAAVLVLAAWATSAADQVLIADPGSIELDERTAEVEERMLDSSSEAPVEDPEPTELPGPLQFLIDALLLLLGASLLGFVVLALVHAYRDRRRSRAARMLTPAPDHTSYADFLEHTHRALTQVTAEQSVALREGDPRNAIVACWVAIEDAIERAGIARNPAETSTELTTRVVGLVAIDTTAIQALGGLYREARFSQHDLGEEQRERAIALLTQLSRQLGEHRPATSVSP
jgi:hypothetical protein